MALSNWDDLAFDLTGQKQQSTFRTPLGIELDIYKNWLYIRDEKAWREGGGYVHPTVMQISQGVVRYHDLNILAARGPQNGVYVLAWHHTPEDPVGLIGCGVYGYSGDEWVGVTSASRLHLLGDFLKWCDDNDTMDVWVPQAISERLAVLKER